MTTPAFHLRKWYFDGVSDDGRAAICYSARLGWRGLSANFTSFLYLSATGKPHIESRFRLAPEPEIVGKKIRWHDPTLKIEGEWDAAAPPIRHRLHESEAGNVDWHCHQPAARCRIRLPGKPEIEGFGYVECLEIGLPIWEMGVDELRWGRFAHPDAPLVWIELRGTPTRRWVFDGQNLVAEATVSDEEIALPAEQKCLLLTEHAAIEDTQKFTEIVRSLVKWLPGFDRFAPLRFLQARETKWRSKGTLQAPGQPDLSGWVIHELVKF